MLAADLDVLWVVGANPMKGERGSRNERAFLVVQDMFLTETAQRGRRGVPGGFGLREDRHRHQRLRRSAATEAGDCTMGAKPDLEIMGLIAQRNGAGADAGSLAAGYGFRRDPQERARLRCALAGDRDWRGAQTTAGERTRIPFETGPT